MRWHILSIGKPKLPFVRQGLEEYSARLRATVSVEFDFLKASLREAESATLLERSAGHFRIALDERGEHLGSRQLADKISGWELARVKSVAILVGGAAGHAEALRSQADWCWSLSHLTLQHEMALLVVLEQIYRAYGIKAGTPYHRD